MHMEKNIPQSKGATKRLMGIILKTYWPHCLVVVICIIGAALAQVRGTLFLQTLIDD